MKVKISKSIDITKYNIDDYYGFIYRTTNLINGKMYIGQCSFGRINGWENYLGSGIYFKRALKKYGCENFRRDIIYLAKTSDILDAVEIACIKHFNAVESDMYYNIKETAKGGDTFSTNPNKEKTRALYRKIRSGKGNSQYGRPKTKKMINAVKESNSKPVMIDGTRYESITEYCQKHDMKATVVCYRLKSKNFTNYLYIGEDGNVIEKDISLKTKSHTTKKRAVVVDGIIYESISKCAKSLGVTGSCISRRIKSDRHPNYQYAIQ